MRLNFRGTKRLWIANLLNIHGLMIVIKRGHVGGEQACPV